MASARPPLSPIDETGAQAVFTGLKLDGFFPEFNAELCGKVFPRSGVVRYAPGEALIEQGEAGRDLFLILAGEVSVQRSRPGEVGRLRPGDLVGEIALVADGVRTATVAAVAPVSAFRLVFEDVGYIFQHNVELAEHLRSLAQARAPK